MLSKPAAKIQVPLQRISVGHLELSCLQESLATGDLSGDGPFTERVYQHLRAIGPASHFSH